MESKLLLFFYIQKELKRVAKIGGGRRVATVARVREGCVPQAAGDGSCVSVLCASVARGGVLPALRRR